MNLSVIIPAFNEVDYLPFTLDSVQLASEHLRDRAGVDVEVIVVDNNSTDGTAAGRRGYGCDRSLANRCRASGGRATVGRALPRAMC